MAVYQYRCADCGNVQDEEFPIGTAPRTSECGCGSRARLRIGYKVAISAHALETKGAEVRAVDEREGRWSKDMPAYKRMRDRGMQPPQIDGSDRLEDHVGDQFDVDYGSLYEKGVTRERVLEGAEMAQEIMAEGVPL